MRAKINKWYLFGSIAVCAALIIFIQSSTLRSPESTSLIAPTVSSDSVIEHTVSEAPTAKAAVLGEVSANLNRLVEGAHVCAEGLNNLNRLEKYCVVSNQHGNFELLLPAADYRVTVSAKGYLSQDRRLNLLPDEIKTENFDLAAINMNLGGQVVSATGEQIIDATITLYRDEQILASTQSDDRGYFSIWADPGILQLQATAPGYGVQFIQVAAPALDLEIKLFPGHTITGQVLSRYQEDRLANVQVVASRNGVSGLYNPFNLSVRTNADGLFKFEGLRPGQYTVAVKDLHWTSTPMETTVVDIQRPNQHLDLYVEQGVSVSGELQLQGDGQYCENAQVALIGESEVNTMNASMAGNQPPVHYATVETQGFFQFPALPYGQYRIFPNCTEKKLISGPDKLTLSPDQSSHHVWLFDNGLALQVTVTDTSNQPMADALVSLQPNESLMAAEVLPKSGVVDATGSYTFGGLVSGDYTIQATIPGSSSNSSAQHAVTIYSAEETQTIRIALQSGSYLNIQSQDLSGASSSRLLFYATDVEGERFEAQPLGGGQFKIGPLQPKQYKVFAYDNKNPKQLIKHQGDDWLVVNGNDDIALQFHYDQPQESLHGRVVDQLGNGVAGVGVRAVSTDLTEDDAFYSATQEVVLGDLSVMTNDNGFFTVNQLSSLSSYDLYIAAPNGMQVVELATMPGEEVNIRLPEPSILTGELSFNEDLHSPRRLVVEVSDSTGKQADVSQYVLSEGGSFQIENLVPGRKNITVYDIESKREINKQVDLAEGDNKIIFN